MPNYPQAPAFPMPDYNYFGQLLGNLPNAYRAAQSDQMKLKKQQMELDQANVFADGLPLKPDGSVDYAKAMDMQARAGDPTALDRYGPILQTQADRREARDAATGALGGIGGSVTPPMAPAPPPGDVPPSSAGMGSPSTFNYPHFPPF